MGGHTFVEGRPQRYWPASMRTCVDISSTFFGVTQEEAVDMVRAYGAEQVLFGTDFPRNGVPRMR